MDGAPEQPVEAPEQVSEVRKLIAAIFRLSLLDPRLPELEALSLQASNQRR